MQYYNNISIKSWAAEDRPREKMLEKGVSALTDAELIAILFGTGSREMSAIDLARKMISEIGGLEKIARADIAEMTKIKGIGDAKAISLAAAFELGRRKSRNEVFETKISGSEVAGNYLMQKIGDNEQEVFWALFLDRKNAIKSEKLISIGGLSSTIIDVRVVFKEAVQQLACSLIVSHNHPSGNLTPSQADKDITKKLVDAGRLFDIPIMDHIIVSNKSYYSFADNGLL